MISDTRLARMIVGGWGWYPPAFDKLLKELQARRAADAELMTVLEKHAAANPPNAAAVLCAQVARQQRDTTISHPLTPLYALVPHLIDAVVATSANYGKIAQEALAVEKPPMYIVATREQIDAIKILRAECDAFEFGPSRVEDVVPLLIAKDKATTDAMRKVSIEPAPGWSEQK